MFGWLLQNPCHIFLSCIPQYRLPFRIPPKSWVVVLPADAMFCRTGQCMPEWLVGRPNVCGGCVVGTGNRRHSFLKDRCISKISLDDSRSVRQYGRPTVKLIAVIGNRCRNGYNVRPKSACINAFKIPRAAYCTAVTRTEYYGVCRDKLKLSSKLCISLIILHFFHLLCKTLP